MGESLRPDPSLDGAERVRTNNYQLAFQIFALVRD